MQAAVGKDEDLFATIVRAGIQALMEAERDGHVGAERFERTGVRRTQRNGYKPRTLVTRVGTLELRVPQTRDGQFYPSVLERYQRSEGALIATLAECWVQGVSTRKVAAICRELFGDEVSHSGGEPVCPASGRGAGAVADKTSGGRVPICVLGRPLREGAPGASGGGHGRVRGDRCERGGTARGARGGGSPWGVAGDLERVPRGARGARPERSPACGLRRPRGAPGCAAGPLLGCAVAAVPAPLPDERAGTGTEGDGEPASAGAAAGVGRGGDARGSEDGARSAGGEPRGGASGAGRVA